MEHGDIIVFKDSFDESPHVTIKYDNKYLFLSLNSFNRRDNLEATISEKYIETGLNILDLSICDVLERRIEEQESVAFTPEDFGLGMILRNKLTDKLNSLIVIFIDGDFYLFTIDLETFEVTPTNITVDSYRECTQNYINDNYYAYRYVNFSDLKIKINL